MKIDMDLAELVGSQKQIAWADTIRREYLTYLSRAENFKKIIIEKEYEDIFNEFLNSLKRETSAAWWIENIKMLKDMTILNFIETAKKIIKVEIENTQISNIQEEIKQDLAIYPKNAITTAVAEINFTDDNIIVRFEKNDLFIKIVKSLNFKWNSYNRTWQKNINGEAIDRAAELGNKLLNAGIPVLILNDKAREMAINATYKEEITNWIILDKDNQIKIVWKGFNDTLYKRAKSLPSARYIDGGIVVSAVHFAEIQEFARLYNFAISDDAKKILDTERNKFDNMPAIGVIDKKKKTVHQDELQNILKTEGILDDLKD